MRLNEWLSAATKQLESVGIGSARLDSLIILEDEFKKDRSFLLAHPETEISKRREKRLNTKLKRRSRHIPMAQIRGFTEFYGRKFIINKHTLEPRPESETMVELLLELAKSSELSAQSSVADVGTGCGAIGISVALELTGCMVDLYEIDAGALAVAKHNLSLHELNLKVYKRDLLNRPARHYDVILANLPYVPDKWQINEAAAMEPRIAIFGGKDGLDLYRRMFQQLAKMSRPPQHVFTESLPPQHDVLAKIADKHSYRLLDSRDFIQVFTSSD